MICSVISQVLGARGPVESELDLGHAAAKPMEFHVHGFVALGKNGVVDDSHCSGIVGLGGRLSLGSFHFYESWRRGTISLAVMNRVASSASTSEDMTDLIISEMVRMVPLCHSLGLSA